MSKTNEELIRDIVNGDEAAFNELYEKYHRMVYYVALKTMNNDADAQDVVQDVFMQIHDSIGTVKNPQYLQLWINRITVNKCNMIFRKRKEVLFEENDKDPLYQYEEHDIDYLPQKHFHFTNDQEIILHFIDQLRPAQRLMITLMYFEELSIEEIATVCNIPEGTVKSRLKTARDTLRRKVELYEKQEGVKLDFHASTLPAALTAAMLWDVQHIKLRPHSTVIQHLSSYHPLQLLGMSAGALLLTAVIIQAPKLFRSLFGESTQESIVATQNETTPKEAYFNIMMWANTPTIIEAKQAEIGQYRKYYNILANEHGVYWDLFLKSGIEKYFH